MDHHYFGVSNILALRGDPPDGQPDYFKPAPNRHTFAWELVDQIRLLNEGRYIVREGFDSPGAAASAGSATSATGVKTRLGTPTEFCIGVAAHPEHEPLTDGVRFLKTKVEMGAKFAITQMIFSATPYARYVDACAKAGVHIPIIPGLRIITQAGTAHRMIEKFGAQIPADFIERLSKATSKEEGKRIGLEHAQTMCRELIAAGAPGVHVFVMNDAETACTLLKHLT
jgi:methylenetetrahydrofolate reductase (NADPH)